MEAYRKVRRNGRAAGVDRETAADIEAYEVERCGGLARDLKDCRYAPRAVLIRKQQAGKVAALGIPCWRDRVVQTSATLNLSPIFEADLHRNNMLTVRVALRWTQSSAYTHC